MHRLGAAGPATSLKRLTSEGVVGERVEQEQDEVEEAKQVQMECCHEKQHDREQILVEGQPDTLVAVLAAHFDQVLAATALCICATAELDLERLILI